MFNLTKRRDDVPMHKWLSTGSILLPHEIQGNDSENIPYIDTDDEKETKISEKDNFWSSKKNGFMLLPKSVQKKSKYREALKILYPWRSSGSCKTELPSSHSGFFSFLSVGWLSKLMWRAFRHGINRKDLWNLPASDAAEKNAERLERLWRDEMKQYGSKASFVKVAVKFCQTRAIISALLIGLAMVFQFISPAILLRLLLQHIDSQDSKILNGIILAFGLFFTQLLRSTFLSLSFVLGFYTGTRFQGALQILLYKKLLRMRVVGEKQAGQIVNFYTNDIERLFESVVTGVLALATPIMFILTLTYSCVLLGPWPLLGHLIILLFYPLMGGMAALITMLRRKAVKYTDERVQLMNEIITSIKLIKMYAWEIPFAKKITDVREKEKKILQKSAFLQSLSTSISPSIVIIATVATFLGHTLSGNPLNAPLAFTVLSVFLALQFSIGTLPYAVKGISEGRVGLQRIQKFLQIPEVNKWTTQFQDDTNTVIKFKDVSCTWDIPGMENETETNNKIVKIKLETKNEECNPLTKDLDSIGEAVLKGVELIVRKGALIGICGSVGSGKSSLLSAVCGDLTLLEGNIAVKGKIAFVTQQAWILNSTLRENILFSLPFVKEKYDDVIRACCLSQDLDLLPNGDLTEIGERGTTLSGGQRQRINLARALYSNRDVYLLDDPLSAVDTKVASHIFEHCIQNSMANKTVLLVTHSMQVLEKCQEVIFMKRGHIAERGTHLELMNKNGEYARMFNLDKAKYQNTAGTEAKESGQKDNVANDDKTDDNFDTDKLVIAEDMGRGAVSWKSYRHYIRSSGGPFVVGLLLFLFLAFVSSLLFSFVWLRYWMDTFRSSPKNWKQNFTFNESLPSLQSNNSEFKDDNAVHLEEHHFQLIYALSVVVVLILGIIKGIFCAKIVLRAASKLHEQMLQRIMRSPISFFETSPSGRILNRFSKDIDEMDVHIPFLLELVIQSLLFIFLQFVISVAIYHMFIIALLLAISLFVLLDWWLNTGVQEFKRLDNILRSTVIVHLTTTLQGLSIIRSYNCESWFIERFYSFINQHSLSHLIFYLANRWFTFRMEIVGISVMGAAALTVVFMKDHTSAGSAGLVLAALFQVCTFLPYVMRMKSELLARFTSMERISSYCLEIAEEAPEYNVHCTAPCTWPQMGRIEFKNVCLRYREDLPLVLENINFKIEAGQKIGVVGRTGAGKSSLLSSLLRLVELNSGSIHIDGIDIKNLGLKQLRSSLAVIPQDPVLFEGTVRYNLDPFSEHTDNQLWEVLDRAHLKYKISQEEKQLEATVEKNGENFSIGERQLLCLARALLRKNKILMLDEATASVDIETDHLIQATIKEMFQACTVITIAHRLNTIWSSDKVIVMDSGKVVEFDTPTNLLSQEGSIFRSMINAMRKSNE
ncbi:ATP-binding cassette sub-family C member 5-like isoform X2 [Centruroides vittatus]|uniref:ATP-binding cassette sub-family C member 5-like isoform X2 n=1 Tax=Centruroides vittatus TaxID=120091 RepID=UPI0035101E04